MCQFFVQNAVRKFFNTTTLHGFKYIWSPYRSDRCWWVWWWVWSAVSAGLLCVALWSRFEEVPALLVAQSPRRAAPVLPLLAVCLPQRTLSHLQYDHHTSETNLSSDVMLGLVHLLQHRGAPSEQLAALERGLVARNLSLTDALLSVTPPCPSVTHRCRWQGKMLPCELLFQKQLTPKGICCVMLPDKLKNFTSATALIPFFRLVLVLTCGSANALYGCEFLTKYQPEDWADSQFLAPGFIYWTHLSYTSIHNNDLSEKIVDWTCISEKQYSRSQCLLECAEKLCGCMDPLRNRIGNTSEYLPRCSVLGFNCLRNVTLDVATCECPPSCEQSISSITIESSQISSLEYVYDPLYENLNASLSVVINMRIGSRGARIFSRLPTETWFTLLSSLGGVFNMFLGVSLFSGLELLFFLILRLPAYVRNSSGIKH